MIPPQTAAMRVKEQVLRDVTLAQAIERADAARALVSAVELDDATRQAALQARQSGVQRVGVADVVLGRAQAIVERASVRDATVAALRAPRWRTALRALPAVALLLGLAADRIANAHRVDLLSPPLLAVLAWNLGVYALLLWQTLRRPAGLVRIPPVLQALQGALARWRAGPGRTVRRGLSARIVAEFEALWLQRSHALLALRTARVLHLCAAAWAAGIALSLLLRGLVVNYRFGWESTFLDASQVHAIVSVLFWPLTAAFGLTPLALQDIAAAQDFAGQGVAGSRWVWMYVGLLALVVVLPRLWLAVWAHWRALRQARQCALDPAEPGFDALRAALPADLVLGLLGVSALQTAALGDASGCMHSAQGDRLCLVLPDDAPACGPVDAVLVCDAASAPIVPAAWKAAPTGLLPWAGWGESWVQEGALFERLGTLLPVHHAALQRLRAAREADQEARFARALQLLAEHLRASAMLEPAQDGAAERHARAMHALAAALRALYGHALAQQEGRGAPSPAAPAQLRRRVPGCGDFGGCSSRCCRWRCGRRQSGGSHRPWNRRADPGCGHGAGRAAGWRHSLDGAQRTEERRGPGAALADGGRGLYPLPCDRPRGSRAACACRAPGRALARRGHRHGGRAWPLAGGGTAGATSGARCTGTFARRHAAGHSAAQHGVSGRAC